MKIIRTSKCSIKFTNRTKMEALDTIFIEYSKVVNHFINLFWVKCPKRFELLKPIVDSPKDTWLSARLRKVAALEAISMVLASKERDKEKAIKPKHKGNKMVVSSTIAELLPSKNAKEFDAWLHLQSIGNKINLQIPIKYHKHFNNLSKRGKRLNSYIITPNYVQFCFEIETGKKNNEGKMIGIDTGIKALASTSENKQYGVDIEGYLNRIKRCSWGSKGQQRARRALKQRIDEISNEVITTDLKLIVVEKLKNLNKGTKLKRRLSKNIRRSLGSWTYRYWLGKIQRNCEDKNVSYRTVFPQYTSQMCSKCSHTERGNRIGEMFLCLRCGYKDNADLNASKNILNRFLTGKYGSCYKVDYKL